MRHGSPAQRPRALFRRSAHELEGSSADIPPVPCGRVRKNLIAAAAALACLAMAGCGTAAAIARAPASTSVPATVQASAPPSPQFTDPNGETCPAPDSLGYCGDDDPLACSTVIDATGWANGPLTELRAVAILSEYLISATPEIMSGTLDDSELTALGGVALDMKNYQGSQLSTDAGQFASDEQSYESPGPSGDPADTAYALPLEKDILILVKDCPAAQRLGQQMASSS
jgi:hypothetical protein